MGDRQLALDQSELGVAELIERLRRSARPPDSDVVAADALALLRAVAGVERGSLILERAGELRVSASASESACEVVDAPLVDRAAVDAVLDGGVPIYGDGPPSTAWLPHVEATLRAVLILEHASPAWFDAQRRAALERAWIDAAAQLVRAREFERDRARERDVRASEAQLRAIIENTNTVVFVKDLDGRYVLVNRQLELDTGLPREHMIGKSDAELFPRETAERIRADDRQIIGSGEPATVEGVTQFPSGPRSFLTTKFPLRDADGQIYALCGVATDITERKRAEQAIAAREEDLRITLDSIGDGVIAADHDGRVSRMNPAAERLTGWPVGEARGRPLAEILRVEEPSAEQGSRYATLLARRGERRPVTQTGAPIRSGSGEIVGRVIVVRDVSDRAALEDQLRHVQRMNAIGQLAGGVAHDFNNTLAGILANAELIDLQLPPERPPELAEALATIIAACDRAGDLTGKLLAFSRRGRRRSEHVDVHEVIATTVALLRRSIDPRIAIELRLAAQNPLVQGDPGLLQSALLNLGVNARDAMPGGGTLEIVTRDVELSPEDCAGSRFELRPGPHLELRVRDTGTGIDEQLRLRIFEPFFTTKEVGRGTGLGLAAVHGTVEEHGGAITLDSAPGRGATFTIVLPSATTLERPRVESLALAPVGEGRILLVDDESVIRTTGARLLESLGFEVVTASDGREGVELFTRHHDELELVLLDMIMPKLSGHDAFRAMKQVDAEVPIVVCSGYAEDDSVRRLHAEGLAGFLPKPYRRAALAELIGRTRRTARAAGARGG